MGGSQRELALVLKLQDQASKELKRIVGEVDAAERASGKWGETLRSVGKQLLYVGTAAAGFLGYGVKIAADLQTAEVGLETLLGSSDKAAKTLARLKKEAARTPFELPGLTQATQLLTSVTKDGDRSIDILLDVGEALAAMGKGQAELDRIIVNLQQIAATGRAATIDIKQFAFAGIPIYEMLAETTGKSGEALEELIASGGVTFDLLTQMFDEANNAGGRFFNAFNNQSGTFNQALSNMKDSFGIFLADIATGTGVFDGLTRAMMLVSSILGDYQTHLENVRVAFNDFFLELDGKTGLVTLLKDAWANVVFVFNGQLKPALQELWTALQPFRPYLEALATVLGGALVIAIGGAIMILGAFAAGIIQALTWVTKLATFIAETFIEGWNKAIDKIADVIVWVEKLIEKFKKAIDLASQIGSFAGGAIKGLGKVIGVDDAVISPRGDIITTHPDDYLIATKDPGSLGGGVNISITGNTFLDQDTAEKVGDLLMKRLKLSAAI